MPGKLYLIPTPLDNKSVYSEVLPNKVIEIIKKLNIFIVEKKISAKSFLKKISISNSKKTLFFEIQKNNIKKTVMYYLKSGYSIGLMSEYGMPCIADPGSEIVKICHEKDITIIPLVGPSSILMTLISSGLNGQNFAFNGYLPVDTKKKIRKIKQMEICSLYKRQTQIFMETPYRNQNLFKILLDVCYKFTLLTVASELTSISQLIKTKPILYWKTIKINLYKKPTMFAIYLDKQTN